MFARGYDDRDFEKDLEAADKGDIKALKRALANTSSSGASSPGGSGTVVLPRAGDYPCSRSRHARWATSVRGR